MIKKQKDLQVKKQQKLHEEKIVETQWSKKIMKEI